MELVDSLEQKKDFSSLRANYYRSTVLWELGQRFESDDYLRLAIGQGLKDYRDLWCYQEVARSLISSLMMEENFEDAVHTAIPLLTILDSVDAPSPEIPLVIRSMLGQCNLKLKQHEQARKNLDIAYTGFKKWLEEDTTGRAPIAFELYLNNAICYAEEKEYAEAKIWLERADSLYSRFCDFVYKNNGEQWSKFVTDYYRANLKVLQAEIAMLLGSKAEAERLYAEYQKLPGAKFDRNMPAATSCLMTMQRYAEAADQFSILDRFMAEEGMKMSLYNLEAYVRKLEANLKAGRKDTALYVARQIVENYDSAYAMEKESEAAKLATIYDTQGKERQIAEQQEELLQQRIIGLVVAIILLTVFFIIYTLVRRRAAKRMAEMRAQQERIENELQIARNIQMSMVPSIFPDYEGLDMYASMTPAKEVGGDLYGYVLQGDKLYFAVGDVSGKGVPASLFMAQATRLFRTLAAQGMMPAEICTRINDALSGEDNTSSMFVTFWLGLLDLKTGHLDFCNCGHNSPIISDKCSADKTDPSSPITYHFIEMNPNAPIGWFPGFEYEGEEIDNIKGRPLFLYTDGLNEAENCQQVQLGNKHLLDILHSSRFDSARQLIDILEDEVKRHREGAESNDDLTMMCIMVDEGNNTLKA